MMASGSGSAAPTVAAATPGCWSRVRHSTTITIVIVFLSLFVDSMLLTLVDPILPDILLSIEDKNQTRPDLDSSTSGVDINDINTGGRYGYLVAAKGLAQFVCNPFVGVIVTRFGYRRPMLIGDIILMASTLAFGYGASYAALFATRVFQGMSSSVTAVTGMGLLANTFTDDTERGKVMGIAIGGISLGIIVGPVYGSLLYQFFGQLLPFLLLAVTVGLTVVLQLLTLKSDDSGGKDHSMSSMLRLLIDPYILIVAGNIFLLNLDVSIILAFLPLRLMDLENAAPWKLGIVVLPTSIGYFIAGLIFPRTTKWLKRWLCALIGMVISTVTLVGLAFSVTFEAMLVTTTFLGIALGMVSTSMQPIFAYLVDIRHTAVYGNVYAISDMAVCAAMFIGPLVGGPIVYTFGFEWLVIGTAIINISYAQLSFLLRDPPSRGVKDANIRKVAAKLNPEKLADLEKLPLLVNHENSTSSSNVFMAPNRPGMDLSGRSSLTASSKSQPAPGSSADDITDAGTMDISAIPVPRYMECLSGVEELYSDSEAARSQQRRKRRRQPRHRDYYSAGDDEVYDSW